MDDRARRHTPSHLNPEILPLSIDEKSKLQSEFLEFARSHELTRVFASDTNRGRHAVEILLGDNQEGFQVRYDRRLRNMNQPAFEDLDFEDVVKTQAYKIWHTKPELAEFGGGETLSDVSKRVSSFLEEHGHKSSLIVSHTTPLQVLLCTLLGIPSRFLWAYKFDFKSFTVVTEKILLRLNSENISDVTIEGLHQIDWRRP